MTIEQVQIRRDLPEEMGYLKRLGILSRGGSFPETNEGLLGEGVKVTTIRGGEA